MTPFMTGDDVFILQNMLMRVPAANVTPSGFYDDSTAAAVFSFKRTRGIIPVNDVFDALAAAGALQSLAADGYVDDGAPPSASGHLYKVVIPVHANRSIETMATLQAANGSAVFSFTVRAHGIDTPPSPPWPYFNSSGFGLNM